MRRDKVLVYTDRAGRWRWRYVAQNGNILADGAQGYSRRVDAVTGARRVTGRWKRRVEIVYQEVPDV